MATQMQTRQRRQNRPERWMKAAERAVHENIQIRQLAGSGAWIAMSGSDPAVAYEVEVTGNVAHGCGCLAGLNGDPVCKHRAAFYLLIGAIDLTPEPDPPAPAVAAECWACCGCGEQWFRGGYALPCPVCRGTGTAPLVAQAAALRADADGTCDLCGGPLDDEFVIDDAEQRACAACVEAGQEEARIALEDAIHADHLPYLAERAPAAMAAA